MHIVRTIRLWFHCVFPLLLLLVNKLKNSMHIDSTVHSLIVRIIFYSFTLHSHSEYMWNGIIFDTTINRKSKYKFNRFKPILCAIWLPLREKKIKCTARPPAHTKPNRMSNLISDRETLFCSTFIVNILTKEKIARRKHLYRKMSREKKWNLAN